MFLFLIAMFFVFAGIFVIKFHHQNKLPPGPIPFPIIGNLNLLGNLPYRSLHKQSKKYGPIMSISLGSIQGIVVSSPNAAKLFLRTHDAIFASRPTIQASKYLCYGSKGIALAKYGPYWRDVKKFCMLELLSDANINGFEGMRMEEVVLMMEEVREASRRHEVVNLSERVSVLLEGMTFRMLFGTKNDEIFALKSFVDEIVKVAGAVNWGDYVPMLAPLDLQGLTRRLKLISKDIDKVFEILINEHEKNIVNMCKKPQKDFIDVMLSPKFQHSNTQDKLSHMLDRSSMKAILVDLATGGIGTSRGSIEWVLSLLLRHPRVMNVLQNELSLKVGDKMIVTEPDLIKLKYLDMVIKETFRLYPAAPILGLHESIQDVVINGYNIPKESIILVNFWSFGRDSNVWSENCEEFIPERFFDSEIDLHGHDFQLIPFSSGRRGCPGKNLGLINIGLVVANLVHCFDWHLPNGMSPDDLDMNEKYGFAMARSRPLLAVPTDRRP